MLSEDFDKKIRDAADHHHPAYDENAWKGMKKLLDEHMPEEKEKKRRGLFFLLFFLLLAGGAALLFVNQPGEKELNNPAASSDAAQNYINRTKQAETPGNKNAAANDDKIATEKLNGEGIPANRTTGGDNIGTTLPDGAVPAAGKNAFIVSGNVPVKSAQTKLVSQQGETNTLKFDKDKPGAKDKDEAEDKLQVTNTNDFVNTAPVVDDNRMAAPASNTTPPVAVVTPVVTKDINDNKPVAATDNKKPDKPEGKKEIAAKTKTASKKESAFFLSASAGPDVSYTTGDKLGKTKLLGGAGIGYTYKERFTIRTGFYSARKIYTASADQYHGSAAFYQFYPNLEKVDANCKVYEIPLAISYNFGKKQNWFASAGVSALLMKQETYNYYYKYMPYGPTITHAYTINNENKHFLSTMTLSAGYQHKIGNRISIVAEPYIKLPLSGVGSGKVMLNSTGVLFTITAKPFGKAEKTNQAK